MNPLIPFDLDIDMAPQLCHHLVGAFIDPDVELDDCHIQAIYDAIQYARRMQYEEK
jgi:hypothetical protein